jgi:glycosyltransferase involved in cell wall biosynthesis
VNVVITVASLGKEFGGPRDKALSLVDRLRDLGHHALVVGCGSREGPDDVGSIGSFHGTPIPRTLAPLRRAVFNADVVHVLGYRDPVGTAAAWTALGQNIPYLIEPVGMHRRRLRSCGIKWAFDAAIGKRLLGGARVVVATSALEAGELTADGVDASKIRVRANGVNLQEPHDPPRRGAFRGRAGIPAHVPLVLALGRITAKKGLVSLVRALAALPDCWGVLAGPDGRDGTLEALEGTRTQLGLQRVKILSTGLWGTAKFEALADADCFCLASATENFGVAPAEAACLGLPVVVSDQCGVAEWLDPQASRVVPYGDAAALSTALRDLLDPKAKGAAQAAAVQLKETLDWGRLARRQVEIYQEVLEGW